MSISVATNVHKRRLQSGVILLVASLLSGLGNVLADHGHPGFELGWTLCGFFAALGLYSLWLTTPSFGAARFEAAVARDVATTTIPLAVAVGLALSLLAG